MCSPSTLALVFTLDPCSYFLRFAVTRLADLRQSSDKVSQTLFDRETRALQDGLPTLQKAKKVVCTDLKSRLKAVSESRRMERRLSLLSSSRVPCIPSLPSSPPFSLPLAQANESVDALADDVGGARVIAARLLSLPPNGLGKAGMVATDIGAEGKGEEAAEAATAPA